MSSDATGAEPDARTALEFWTEPDARAELAALRARLAPQRVRLHALGVPESELQPSKLEVAAATQALTGDPAGIRAALRAARAAADQADLAIVAGQSGPAGRWTAVGLAVAATLLLVLLGCLGTALPALLR